MKDFKFFTHELFYGSGDSTEQDIAEVQSQVNEIHSLISGTQQPCHCHYNCNCKEDNAKAWEMVAILRKSVANALGIR